jgi:hypothetical protein
MNDVGFGFDDLNPVKHIKKAAKSVGKAISNPGKALTSSLGTVANVAPAVALAASGGGLGLLALKGGAEVARGAGAPKVVTTFADPSGPITHGVAKGTTSGLKSGGLLGALRGGLAGGIKGGKEVTSNPLIRATAAGLTFVIPPAGVALSGGLVALDKGLAAADKGMKVADKLVGAYEHGSAPVKKAVAQVYAKTAAAAKAGDAGAKVALLALSAAKTKLEAMRSHTYFISPSGQISRGKYTKTAAGVGARVGFYVRADGHVERGTFKAG